MARKGYEDSDWSFYIIDIVCIESSKLNAYFLGFASFDPSWLGEERMVKIPKPKLDSKS